MNDLQRTPIMADNNGSESSIQGTELVTGAADGQRPLYVVDGNKRGFGAVHEIIRRTAQAWRVN